MAFVVHIGTAWAASNQRPRNFVQYTKNRVGSGASNWSLREMASNEEKMGQKEALNRIKKCMLLMFSIVGPMLWWTYQVRKKTRLLSQNTYMYITPNFRMCTGTSPCHPCPTWLSGWCSPCSATR